MNYEPTLPHSDFILANLKTADLFVFHVCIVCFTTSDAISLAFLFLSLSFFAPSLYVQCETSGRAEKMSIFQAAEEEKFCKHHFFFSTR